MSKMVKKVLKITIYITIIILSMFVVYIGFIIITDYKPDAKILTKVNNNKTEIINKNTIISIVTYNIGYGGMDKYQDFFLSGGKGSRSSSFEKTLENIEGVKSFIQRENPDIVILQEVDKKSTRSYSINEVDYFKERLDNYSSSFELNYKIPWIILPLNKPYGTVNSGLLTLSKFNISASTRYKYPGEEAFLKQIFEFDRCFLETRMPVEGGKELVLINSQLSTYSKGGYIRKQQLAFLKNYIKREYNKGNYVIVGGDWNHIISGIDSDTYKAEQTTSKVLQAIPEDFAPKGFMWAIDKEVPSNRSIDTPYREGINYLSIVDGYLISPNVDIKLVSGYDLKFDYSNHNPVGVNIILKALQ